MKKLHYFFYILFVFAFSCDTEIEPETNFFRVFGSQERADMAAVTVQYIENEKNYVLMGYNWADNITEQTVWILKANQEGERIWFRKYPRYSNPVFELRVLSSNDMVFLAQDAQRGSLVVVRLNAQGDIISELELDPDYQAPTYLSFAYEKDQLVFLVDKNVGGKSELHLLNIDIFKEKIIWEQSYPELVSGGDYVQLTETPAVLIRLGNEKGYSFVAYSSENSQPYVCFTNENGVMSRKYATNQKLRSYTEASKGFFAAIYGEPDGGSFVAVHTEEQFEISKYDFESGISYFVNEINPQFRSFIRSEKDGFILTATSYLSEIVFLKLSFQNQKLEPQIRKIYGSGDRLYYVRSRPHQHPNGGYYFLGRLDFGKQFAVWRTCLIKTDFDGDMTNGLH